MRAVVHVFLKPGVLDVQGKAVEAALHGLGYSGVSNVRVGRVVELDVNGADAEAAMADVETMCNQLLANPVIEGYRVEIGA